MANLLGWILLGAAAIFVALLACGFSLMRSLSIAAIVALAVVALLVLLMLLNGDT